MVTKKLTNALRACLDECYRSTEPFTSLTGYLGRLRQDPTWTEPEVDQLQSQSLRILAAVLTRREPVHSPS